jgi:hypothetical protein
LLSRYIMTLLKGLYTWKIRHFCIWCAFMGFLDCQKFICNTIILFKGWVFLVTSPVICKKFGIFKIVLSKMPFFLCHPTKCKNQTEISYDTSKTPIISQPPFIKSTLLSLCYFIKIFVSCRGTNGAVCVCQNQSPL